MLSQNLTVTPSSEKSSDQSVGSMTAEDLPLLEFIERHSVRETLSANTNTFQNTITPQLMQNEVGIDLTRLFVLVWNNTTHEMRSCRVQHCHEFI